MELVEVRVGAKELVNHSWNFGLLLGAMRKGLG